MDIPVYKSKVQSLHVLFTLYAEFKNSQVRKYNMQNVNVMIAIGNLLHVQIHWIPWYYCKNTDTQINESLV